MRWRPRPPPAPSGPCVRSQAAAARRPGLRPRWPPGAGAGAGAAMPRAAPAGRRTGAGADSGGTSPGFDKDSTRLGHGFAYGYHGPAARGPHRIGRAPDPMARLVPFRFVLVLVLVVA